MSDPRKRLSWAWSGLLVCVLAACTTITENVPSSPSDSVTVVVVPLASPIAQPSTPVAASPPTGGGVTQPSPTPQPSATPTAAPTPDPVVTPMPGTACSLPAGNPNAPCFGADPQYLGDVTAAIDEVIKANPGWFAPQSCSSCYIALDPTRFVNAVMRALQQKGYCVINDGEELGVKATNAFNEQYDILSSSNWVRRAYAATCAPSWF